MAEEIQEMDILTITNEDGQEVDYEILFTFNSEEYKRNYVVFASIDEDEDEFRETHAMAYVPNENGEGRLTPIDDDAEWDMIEDIIASFVEEMEEDDESFS